MKPKRSRKAKELAKRAYEAILVDSKEKGLILSKFKDKLLCNHDCTLCYDLIRKYQGTAIEDVCWEVLDIFYDEKSKRVLIV